MKMTRKVGGKRSRFGAIGPCFVPSAENLSPHGTTRRPCESALFRPILLVESTHESGFTPTAGTLYDIPSEMPFHIFPCSHSLASARYALRSLSNSLMYLSLVVT